MQCGQILLKTRVGGSHAKEGQRKGKGSRGLAKGGDEGARAGGSAVSVLLALFLYFDFHLLTFIFYHFLRRWFCWLYFCILIFISTTHFLPFDGGFLS